MRPLRNNLFALACAVLASWTAHAGTVVPQSVPLDIAAQPLGDALSQLSAQTGLQIILHSTVARGLKSIHLSGRFTPQAALDRLLADTGLHYEYLGPEAVAVMGPDEPPTTKTSTTAPESVSLAQSNTSGPAGDTTQNTFPQGDTDEAKGPLTLEEVVVTAQKRVERLQDVPVPVTVLDAGTLVNSNQFRLQDYYTMIPGLNVTPADTRGSPVLAIRGITTGGSLNPTVGIAIDDIPYGATTTFGGGFAAPDIDPSDLARVEVLRGPQGTLYGASSIGGLLKFDTVDPSTDAVNAHVQVGTSSVYNGAELGYLTRGAVNVPISDTIAIRASAFAREDPGYIDNVLTGQDGVNRLNADGGRLSALWLASPSITWKFGALFQHATTDGASEVDLAPASSLQSECLELSDLQQCRVRNSGGYDKQVQAYSSTLKAKVGGMDLTSLTGYSINTGSDSQDFTGEIGSLTAQQFNGVVGTPTIEHNQTKKFSQELRLSSSLGQSIEWLVGVFYTHEASHYTQDILAANPLTGSQVGIWSTDVIPSTYEEYAAFADLTLHVTDRFDVQVGARESENKQAYAETILGPFVIYDYGLSSVVNPQVDTKDNSFTYLVTPELKITPDYMVYARLASGYRPGGPNATSTVFHEPSSYEPDKTENYEVGAKGEALNHAITFDMSLYYIDWKDIQLVVTDPANLASYFINGPRAKSQGVELSGTAKPTDGMTIAAWVAWDDAQLTQSLPPGEYNYYGPSGSRLPNSSRFSGNLSFDEQFPLWSSVTGFLGGTLSYVGDREGVFTIAEGGPTPPARQLFPSYARTDLRCGIKYESWKLDLFVTNLTDRRAVLSGGVGTFNSNAFTYIQPRTIGLSIEKSL